MILAKALVDWIAADPVLVALALNLTKRTPGEYLGPDPFLGDLAEENVREKIARLATIIMSAEYP